MENYFSTKSFILACGNGISGLWKPNHHFLIQRVFLLAETVTETSGSKFLGTGFLTSRNHFFQFCQTTVNYFQWEQFFLQLEHIFQSILYYGKWKTKISDSDIRKEGFVKKNPFHYAEKLPSPAGIYIILVGEKLFYKKRLHLNLINGFHLHKVCSV